MSSIMKGLVDEQDIEETKKLSAQEKFKRSMKRAGYDMDAGAKRLQDLLDKQKKEREEFEKKEKEIKEGPAVDAYMAGKSPAIANFANKLDNIASQQQGVTKEDATLQFAAEVTPKVSPYAGIKDRKFRGAIGEGLKTINPYISEGWIGAGLGGLIGLLFGPLGSAFGALIGHSIQEKSKENKEETKKLMNKGEKFKVYFNSKNVYPEKLFDYVSAFDIMIDLAKKPHDIEKYFDIVDSDTGNSVFRYRVKTDASNFLKNLVINRRDEFRKNFDLAKDTENKKSNYQISNKPSNIFSKDFINTLTITAKKSNMDVLEVAKYLKSLSDNPYEQTFGNTNDWNIIKQIITKNFNGSDESLVKIGKELKLKIKSDFKNYQKLNEEPNYSPTDAGYQEGGWRKMIEEELNENLRKWFKEKWVRFGPDGKIRGACARGSSSEGKPKCLPQAKAHALGKKGRKYAAAKKRREDPNPERSGPAKNVATKKKSNEAANPAQQAAIAINMKKLGKKPKSESINEGLWDWIKDKLSNNKPIQWSENYYDFIIRNDPTYLQTYLNAVKNDPNYIEWKKNNPNKPQQSTSQTNYASSQNRPNQSASFDDFTAPHGSSENEFKMFVNGQKPAAIVPEPNFSTWAKVINSGKYWTKQLFYNGRLHSVIIVQPGNEQSGQQIYELVQNAMKLAEKGDFRAYQNSNYHRRLGKLLGYPKDKVEQFINNYFKDREDLAKIKIDEQGVKEGYSDMFGLLSASNLNNSYIVTAELAEGGKKKFRVKAQSERVAIEKFKKHHSMAKIIKVEEEGVKEGSKYPRNPASYHLKKYPVPQDQMAKPVKKEPKKPEQKPEEKVDEGKRIPRKPGQPANSKKHSDLYTDENPKGTIHGLKFATAEDARASVSKIRNSGRSHAHKIQAAVAMEQRAKAAGKAEAASVYRKFINSMKKKTDESQIDEACWKGYHKEGMKTMFGKKYPNCVKNKKKTNEDYQQCPECGGAMYEVSLMNEKKDACYYKVKSRYKVWPSAYASGALVKCRKKGASNWGNKSKSNEGQIYSTGGGAGQSYRYFTPKDNLGESSSILSGITQVDEGLKSQIAGAALAAAMAAGGAQADNTRRVTPQADGTMSPSYAQHIASASQNLRVVKPLPNNFEQIVYKGMNGVRDKDDGTIVLIGNAPNSVQVIRIENNKETTDYMDIKQLGNETKQALSLIVKKSESQPLGKPTPGVTYDREQGTINYNGKDYKIVKIYKDGPQPRISRFDAKVQVPYPDFGIRSLGVVNVTLAGDTAYAYLN